MELVATFAELSRHDATLAGGKGASLGEMTQAGIPVPPGFVVLAESFEQFLRETDLNQEIAAVLGRVQHDQVHTVEAASETIRSLILSREMPADIKEVIVASYNELNAEFVAVRSSATAEDGVDHAWAGQLESYLNVRSEAVLDKVKLCWSSLFTPRAIFYRFEKGLHTTTISVAVVIQAMVESEVSGIAFSVHPVTEDHNQLIIEAGFGLGEAIVSGSVTPDSYVVSKQPRHIIDINVSTQTRALYRAASDTPEHGNNEWRTLSEPQASAQVLTEDQILELSGIILTIETHYGFPCDIEWAFEKGTFYIVQSRPITTLSKKNLPREQIMLRKYFTREHTLFYTSVWRESNCKRAATWIGRNIEQVVFVRREHSPAIEVWYSDWELVEYRRRIEERCTANPAWFTGVADCFEREWANLLPYLKRTDALSQVELQAFTNHWLAWWEPMALMMQIPEIDALPEEVRQKAYELRAATQEYADRGDEVYVRAMQSTHPNLEKYISVLLPEEIFSDTVPSHEVLEKRSKEGFFLTHDSFGTGRELTSVLEKNNFIFETEVATVTEEGATEVRGNAAFKGIVRGKAKIVLSKQDILKIEAGDVLITAMTSPDHVPYMHKAVAFVTDEGGITCHAAIVSREMQKPCVIGTKNATHVFKDGDIVEVDADSGVVRKLEALNFVDPDLPPLYSAEWQHFGMWKQDVFSACFWQTCFNRQTLAQYGFMIGSGSTMIANGGHFFYHKPTVEVLTQYVASEIEKANVTLFKQFSADARATYESGVAFAETVSDEAPLTREYFSEVLRQANAMTLYWWFSAVHLAEAIESVLQVKVGEYAIPVDDLASLTPAITTPLSEQQKDLKRLNGLLQSQSKDEVLADPALLHELEAHRKTYAWIEVSNWIGEELTLERVLDQVNHSESGEKAPPQSPPADIETLLACLGYIGFAKEAGAQYLSQFEYHVLPYLKRLATHLGLTHRELMACTHDEIKTALGSGTNTLKAEADSESRTAGKWIIHSKADGSFLFVTNEHDTERIHKEMVPQADVSLRELRGDVGNKGKATGTVKVILNLDDFHKMKTGDVLVTTMTTPDFVILMQKASAVVTDVGGVLCHAAIISREVNVPCVIGTRIASQVLKDGDMVEVDADKGVVRILENNDLLPTKVVQILEEKKPLHPTVRFPKIPVLYIEAALRSYINNPFYRLADSNPDPCCIATMNEQFTFWVHQDSVPSISTATAINEIKEDTINNIPLFEIELKKFLESPVGDFSDPKALKSVLTKVSQISTQIYYRFSLFIDESLHTSDPVLIHELQEIRMSLDTLVVSYLFKSYDRIITILTETHKFDSDVIKHATEAEISDLLDGLKADTSSIKNRALAFIVFANNITIMYGQAAEEIAALLEKQDPDIDLAGDARSDRRVKGMTGNPGLASGRVITISPADYKNKEKLHTLLHEADFVLVAPMTVPGLVPYFKNAVAFITDEGGITCHAAIIAREMNKPCVIGTRIASQVLRDGDMVEVDADKGVIRIL